MCCEEQGAQDERLETPERRALHDIGFFGHFIYTRRGGRGGRQHVLKTLYYADGQMTQRALLEKTRTTSASLSEVVGKLESAGLVERERSETDRRQLVVRLTEEGRARAQAVIADKERFERDAFSCLGPGELDELLGLLDRLREHWEQVKRDEDERGDAIWLKN